MVEERSKKSKKQVNELVKVEEHNLVDGQMTLVRKNCKGSGIPSLGRRFAASSVLCCRMKVGEGQGNESFLCIQHV